MPRGTCENCEEHDAFVYASPLAFGRNVFVCVQCLPHEWDEDDENADCPCGNPPSANTAR